MTYSELKQSQFSGEYSQVAKPDICWKLLLLAIFFSPLRCYGLFTIGTFTGSLFKIFSLLMILFTLIKALTRTYRIYLDMPLKLISLIIFMDIITVVYSNGMGLFPSYFVSHVILLFGYIVVQNATGKTESLLKAYVYGAIIPGVLGLYQWISVMTGRGVPQLPFQQFLVTAGKDDIFLYGNYRVVGTLQDPSYYGLFMASVFVICVGLLITENSTKKRIEKVMIALIAALSVFCVISSGSVTSMVAAVSGTVFILLFNRNTISKMLKYVFYVGIALVVALYLMIYVFSYDPLQVLFSKLRIQAASSSVGSMYGRGAFFSDALNDFWRSPLWGVGFGNMTRSSGHNSFLTILALQGIIGFVLHFLLLIVYPFLGHKTRMILRRKGLQRSMLVVCCAALLGMVVQVMGYDCLYKMDPSIVIILLVFASIKIGEVVKYDYCE